MPEAEGFMSLQSMAIKSTRGRNANMVISIRTPVKQECVKNISVWPYSAIMLKPYKQTNICASQNDEEHFTNYCEYILLEYITQLLYRWLILSHKGVFAEHPGTTDRLLKARFPQSSIERIPQTFVMMWMNWNSYDIVW